MDEATLDSRLRYPCICSRREGRGEGWWSGVGVSSSFSRDPRHPRRRRQHNVRNVNHRQQTLFFFLPFGFSVKLPRCAHLACIHACVVVHVLVHAAALHMRLLAASATQAAAAHHDHDHDHYNIIMITIICESSFMLHSS